MLSIFSILSCEKDSDPDWTLYACEDTLSCKAGSILILELNSGGILSSAMRVDQLEISKVE